MSITFNYKGDGNINFPAAGLGSLKIIPDSVAQSPQNQNLIYLFDPLYYNGYVAAGGSNYIAYLKKIYNRYPSILPSSDYVFSRGQISNKGIDPNNLIRKGIFNNFFFSYEKYSDNSDIPLSHRPKRKLSKIYGVKERRGALLKLIDPLNSNTFNLFQENNSKTFSCFIKLKGPVQHRSTALNNQYKIIREKKGIFLNTGQFSVGYRSPHYTRTGNINAYKFKFEPFSFVFSIMDDTYNHSFMTDFKYKFNETYHLSITVECGSTVTVGGGGFGTYYYTPTTVKVYINGEQQTTAYMTFNPLINGNGKAERKNKRKKERLNSSPIQPGFYKTDGTIYSPILNSHIINCKIHNLGTRGGRIGWNNLYLGKSNMTSYGHYSQTNQSSGNIKRYLNNIDVGVIQIYNSVLSNTDIKKIYNTFGPRYQ